MRMNKEQQELLDGAYENYSNKLLFNEKDCHVDYLINQPNKTFIPYSQERFINKCKTDSEFSQGWGLKIEEQTILEQVDQNNLVLKGSTALYPRKLITITYNDIKIESYE